MMVVVASLAVVLLLSRAVVNVKGDYSNTILYPVTEESRAARASKTTNANANTAATAGAAAKTATPPKRQPGAPSRYLEYEGPDATYSIRVGSHPTITYPDLDDFTDTEIRIRKLYGRSPSRQKKMEIDDCPRHFLWLSDRAVEKELDHRVKLGTWSERVLVEKTYFTLFYGGTGLASKYMDSVDDFQTDLVGWEIMNRSSNHCDWEGIECDDALSNMNTRTPSDQRGDFRRLGAVVGFQINGFSLEGTLPDDLRHLSHLKRLDLHGNRIQGSIPSSWGALGDLTELNLEDNRLTGTLPPTLEGWTSLRNVRLSRNRLEGSLPGGLLEAWTKPHPPDNNEADPSGSKMVGGDGGGRGSGKRHRHARKARSLRGLESLDLSRNQFTGSFPMEVLVLHAKDLTSLDLSDNRFGGILPDEVVPVFVLPDTIVLGQQEGHAHPNQIPLDGIPHPFRDCMAILDGGEINEKKLMEQQECIRKAIMDDPRFAQRVSTARHQQSITVPPAPFQAYAGLGKLSFLDLSRNRFRGPLPRAWAKLPALSTVVLAHNDLTGSLPSELWNLASLARLDLVRARVHLASRFRPVHRLCHTCRSHPSLPCFFSVFVSRASPAGVPTDRCWRPRIPELQPVDGKHSQRRKLVEPVQAPFHASGSQPTQRHDPARFLRGTGLVPQDTRRGREPPGGKPPVLDPAHDRTGRTRRSREPIDGEAPTRNEPDAP